MKYATVKDLIDFLQKFPEDANIFIGGASLEKEDLAFESFHDDLTGLDLIQPLDINDSLWYFYPGSKPWTYHPGQIDERKFGNIPSELHFGEEKY